jgi:hypothetical protein
MHLSCEIAGGHVPRDELVGHADDVAEVGRQLEAEHRKLEAKSFGCRKGNIFFCLCAPGTRKKKQMQALALRLREHLRLKLKLYAYK